MSTRALLRITLLCVFFLMPTACGYLFVNGPPPNHERLNFFTCTQSRVMPGIDALWTAGSALVIVGVLSGWETNVQREQGVGKGAVVAIYGSWGAATALTAASGFKKVNQCRTATALLMERLSPAPDAASATPSLEALAWRPPQLFPVHSPLNLAPIKLSRPKPEASPGY